MDLQSVLAAYAVQVRQHPDPPPGGSVERDDHVVRVLPGDVDGWAGVVWSDLDERSADPVIAREVARFVAAATSSGRDVELEWKWYSGDQPVDLRERLTAAGFVAGEPETLLVAEIADLDRDARPPAGVELAPVTDSAGADDLVGVHDKVFGGDHAYVGRAVLAGLAQRPPTSAAVVARADGHPVAAARLELHHGSEFASIWGGGTLPPWRGRGIFRALVAHRAAVAAQHGFRYLQVDALPPSRSILGRLGFVELASTIPFTCLVGAAPASARASHRLG